VKVQQQAVTVAEKLYNDNKKQLEIGTMAPLDVTRADQNWPRIAKISSWRRPCNCKTSRSKERHHEESAGAEYRERRDYPHGIALAPGTIEAPSFQQAASEAFAKRPDFRKWRSNILNGQIDVSATRNALLPTATLTAQYGSVGLAGNSRPSPRPRSRARPLSTRQGAYSR